MHTVYDLRFTVLYVRPYKTITDLTKTGFPPNIFCTIYMHVGILKVKVIIIIISH